jgi:hypothetical protein
VNGERNRQVRPCDYRITAATPHLTAQLGPGSEKVTSSERGPARLSEWHNHSEADVMANDKSGSEQPRLEAQRTRDKAERESQVSEKGRRLTEENRVSDEAARGEAEQLRRLAEESREIHEQHREALEQMRQHHVRCCR